MAEIVAYSPFRVLSVALKYITNTDNHEIFIDE